MTYDAVIFDLHNTLVPFSKDGFRRMVSQMAAVVEAPDDGFARVVEEITHESMIGQFGSLTAQVDYTCRALGIEAAADRIEQAMGLWVEFHRQQHEDVFPTAVPTLEGIRQMGLKTGLISNCALEAPAIWPETRLASLIDAAIFSCSVGFTKPDPCIYLLACENLAVAPERCLYVDDSVRCLGGAREVGMQPVLLHAEDDAAPPTWAGRAVTELTQVLDFLHGTGITIQPFRPQDQAAVKELILAGLADHFEALDTSKNPDLNDIGSHYADAVFLVAWFEDRIVGTGALVPREEETAEIVRMSVAADMRRQGIGSAVLQRLCAQAKANVRRRRVVLETTETWSEVIEFYKRSGFRVTHHTDGEAHLALDLG